MNSQGVLLKTKAERGDADLKGLNETSLLQFNLLDKLMCVCYLWVDSLCTLHYSCCSKRTLWGRTPRLVDSPGSSLDQTHLSANKHHR